MICLTITYPSLVYEDISSWLRQMCMCLYQRAIHLPRRLMPWQRVFLEEYFVLPKQTFILHVASCTTPHTATRSVLANYYHASSRTSVKRRRGKYLLTTQKLHLGTLLVAGYELASDMSCGAPVCRSSHFWGVRPNRTVLLRYLIWGFPSMLACNIHWE